MNAAHSAGAVVAKKYARLHGENGVCVGGHIGCGDDMACAGDWPVYACMVNGRDEWTAHAGKFGEPGGEVDGQ